MPQKLPVSYKSNKKAWMTSAIFEDFVLALDKSLSQPSVLLLDNASVHGIAGEKTLQHLKIVFLPPNTTSRTQPCDAGIIQALKLRYRKAMVDQVTNFDFTFSSLSHSGD